MAGKYHKWAYDSEPDNKGGNKCSECGMKRLKLDLSAPHRKHTYMKNGAIVDSTFGVPECA